MYSFPYWNQSVVLCPVLTVASWPAYRFLRRQVRWFDIPISLRIFHSLLWSTQSKALAFEAEIDFSFSFLEFPCFLYDPADTGNLISDSSAFSKSSLYILKFLVHVLLKQTLKHTLKHLEQYLANLWKRAVIWTFFVIALGIEIKTAFPDLWPLLSFPNSLVYWVQHFNSNNF